MRMDFFGDSREKTPFSNVFMAMWWVITTITTVGYGDMYVTTLVGRIIGVMAMVLGVIGFAMPITIIGTTFSEEYEKLAGKAGPIDIYVQAKEEFKKFDKDRSGTLSEDEFISAMYNKFDWTSSFSAAIFKKLTATKAEALQIITEDEYGRLVEIMNSVLHLFGEYYRRQSIASPAMADMIDAGMLKYNKDNGITEQGLGRLVRPISPPTSAQVSMVAPFPTPLALEAPTPARHTNVAPTPTRPPPNPRLQASYTEIQEMSTSELSALQVLLSQELHRRCS